MRGESALTLLPPFPEDPLDPVDPLDPGDCPQIGDVIEMVDVLRLGGAPARCFFGLFVRQPHANHLLLKLFFVKSGNPSRIGSRWIARLTPGRMFTQNCAAILMEATICFSRTSLLGK